MLNEYIIENWRNSVRFEKTGNGLWLPYPYTVPCVEERFTCFFYWDTYFANLGLLRDYTEQARNNLENMKHFVRTLGYIPNGNEQVMFNRSQPPLYSCAVRDYYRYTGDETIVITHYESMKKEYSFWMRERMTVIGLNQYGSSPHTQEIMDFYEELKSRNGFASLKKEESSILPYFAEAESGWDFSPRYNGKATQYVQADLNAIMYGTELFLAECAELLGKLDESRVFVVAAQKRSVLMKKYLCDADGIYHDYNFVEGEQSKLVTCAAFVPFAMEEDKNSKACKKILEYLELTYGLSAGDINTGGQGFQWAYPNMWPPLVFWAYRALKNCGLHEDALRIMKKYMDTVEQNFESTGALWEKYNAETGLVSSVEYDSPKMMGWTAGVYRYFHFELSKSKDKVAAI